MSGNTGCGSEGVDGITVSAGRDVVVVISDGIVDAGMGVSLGVTVLALLRLDAAVLLWDDCIEELRGV